MVLVAQHCRCPCPCGVPALGGAPFLGVPWAGLPGRCFRRGGGLAGSARRSCPRLRELDVVAGHGVTDMGPPWGALFSSVKPQHPRGSSRPSPPPVPEPRQPRDRPRYLPRSAAAFPPARGEPGLRCRGSPGPDVPRGEWGESGGRVGGLGPRPCPLRGAGLRAPEPRAGSRTARCCARHAEGGPGTPTVPVQVSLS